MERSKSESIVPSLEVLFDHYLDQGCPCRFPRFRATVGRDTYRLCGVRLTTQEQRDLIRLFDKRVEVVGRTALQFRGVEGQSDIALGPYDYFYEGRCAKCGSKVERWFEEERDGGLDHLMLRRVRTPDMLAELGAPLVSGQALRTGSWQFVGPVKSGWQAADKAYPLVDFDSWFAWMVAPVAD